MKRIFFINFAIFLNFITLFFSAANSALAIQPDTSSQGGFSLGDKFSLGKNPMPVSKVYNTPADIMNIIVRNLFVIAGVIFFLLIIYSGFKFIYQGKKGAEETKTIMTTAVMGLIIMFAAYWIIQIIELITGIK